VNGREANSGFTLIELAVCLVVMGLLAAMTAVSLRGAARMHRMEDVVDQLRTMDQMTRTSAVRFDRPTTLHFDIEGGVVVRNVEQVAGDLAVQWNLPSGIAIEGVRVQGHAWADRRVDVQYAPAGYSGTYAIGLRSADGAEAYCLIAGLTGQMTQVESREHVDAIFESLATTH